MATTGLARLTVPGAMSENHTLAAALVAIPVIAAIDLEIIPTVPLNFLYAFPLALVALNASRSYTLFLVTVFSFLAQLYVLSSYGLSRSAFLADMIMIAFACVMTVVAMRAIRRSYFRAEAAASNTKLVAALESTKDAVVITDAGGNFLDFNEAFAIYHRFRSRQECARRLAEYPDILDVMTLNGEVLPLEHWAMSRALRGESTTNADYMLRLKSTGETWIGNYSFAPIRNEDGSIIGSIVSSRDVTEQKKAELEVRQAYELLTLAEQSALAGSWSWNFANDSFTWSPQFYRLFGLDPQTDEASLPSWRKALHPDDVVEAERRTNEAIGTHTQYTNTYRVRWPDGEIRWIETVGTTTYNEQGKPVRMSGICLDITNRRIAEDKLRETQSDFQAFFDNVSVGAAQIDRSCRFLSANPRLCAMTGYAQDELVGKMSPLNFASPEEHRAVREGTLRIFERKDKLYYAVHRLIRKDGTTRWVEVAASPILGDDGKVQKLAGIVTDVTERRTAELKLLESEANLKAFFNNAIVGAVQLDEKGRFTRVNPAYCAIVGYTSDELIGKMTPADIDAPEFRAADQDLLKRLLDGLDPQYIVEKQICRKDGTRRWVRVAATSLEQTGGQIHRTAAVVTDITSRKDAEARLLESRDQLQTLNLSLEAEVQSRTASLMEANRQLGKLARMDALTHIPNRLSANERVRQEYVLMKRMKQPYAVLMIDIDHFKVVNDTYGHEVGDRVLQEIAQNLRNELRESDFLARFGGEEFIALLPATAMEGGLVAASKLRKSIEDLNITGVNRVTISVGVSVASSDNASQDVAVNEADSALYEAKAAGRNIVMSYSAPRAEPRLEALA